jgi:hypothetical protein
MPMIQIRSDNGAHLGWAKAIIDLTNGEAEPPVYLTPMEVTGTRFMIGHTRNLADRAEPVIVREADISDPPASGMGYAEGRCGECTGQGHVGSIGGSGDVMMVLEHQDGCRVLRELLDQAGMS